MSHMYQSTEGHVIVQSVNDIRQSCQKEVSKYRAELAGLKKSRAELTTVGSDHPCEVVYPLHHRPFQYYVVKSKTEADGCLIVENRFGELCRISKSKWDKRGDVLAGRHRFVKASVGLSIVRMERRFSQENLDWDRNTLENLDADLDSTVNPDEGEMYYVQCGNTFKYTVAHTSEEAATRYIEDRFGSTALTLLAEG